MGIEIANAERMVMDATAEAIEPPPQVDYLRWAEDNIVFTKRERDVARACQGEA